MTGKDEQIAVTSSKKEQSKEKKDTTPRILLSGSKVDLLGLTEPVHMCSNCWNNKGPTPD